MTHLPDVRYLSGFTGSSAALAVTRRAARLFTDGRYRTQAGEEVSAARVDIVYRRPGHCPRCVAGSQPAMDNAGFDAGWTTVADLGRWKAALPSKLQAQLSGATEKPAG